MPRLLADDLSQRAVQKGRSRQDGGHQKLNKHIHLSATSLLSEHEFIAYEQLAAQDEEQDDSLQHIRAVLGQSE